MKMLLAILRGRGEGRWGSEHFRGDRIEKWSGDAGANQEVLQ